MRAGSKGVKNKNLKMLNGRPLMAYAIEQAQDSKLFDHIVVSNVSEEIQKQAIELGAESWFLRPKRMATDTAGKLPVIKHTVKESEKFFGVTYDVIVDLDVTAPLRSSEDIVLAYEQLLEQDADNLISVCEARKNPYFNMVEIVDKKPELVKVQKKRPVRRQDAPVVYDMNAALFMWQKRAIIDYENLISHNTLLYEMPAERSIDIDSQTDWDFVEFMMNKRN